MELPANRAEEIKTQLSAVPPKTAKAPKPQNTAPPITDPQLVKKLKQDLAIAARRIAELEAINEQLVAGLQRARQHLDGLVKVLPDPKKSREIIPKNIPLANLSESQVHKNAHISVEESGLSKGARTLLSGFASIYPRGRSTLNQAAARAGQSVKSSALRPNHKALINAGLIEPTQNNRFTLTPAGLQISGTEVFGSASLADWCARFPRPPPTCCARSLTTVRWIKRTSQSTPA